MGKHKEWRKVAKNERRRKLRILQAKERDGPEDPNSVEYLEWVKEQQEIENFKYEQIEKTNIEENEKWLRAERIAMDKLKKLEEQKEMLRIQLLEEETKIQLEWELEQEQKKEEERRLKEIEEKNKLKQEIFMKHLESFLTGDAVEPPEELLVSKETRPECQMCPFFSKTGCCRFGDQCSRNHRFPGVSKVLLATNFFSHFGLENANDYDVDIMLEYEDSDTYKEFKEFFFDVLPEFEKFGRITQFKVCNNYEKHLRGNTYVEFAELRCAVAAYRALHTRWYGGRQLSLQFCLISSWKNAICGLQTRKRCPKGRACNFMHVFKNPDNMFNRIKEFQDGERSHKTPPRSWRWSESPEVEIPRYRSRSSERRREGRDRRQDSRRSERSRRNHHRDEREKRDNCREDRGRRKEERTKDKEEETEENTPKTSRAGYEKRHSYRSRGQKRQNDDDISSKDDYKNEDKNDNKLRQVKENSPSEEKPKEVQPKRVRRRDDSMRRNSCEKYRSSS